MPRDKKWLPDDSPSWCVDKVPPILSTMVDFPGIWTRYLATVGHNSCYAMLKKSYMLLNFLCECVIWESKDAYEWPQYFEFSGYTSVGWLTGSWLCWMIWSLITFYAVESEADFMWFIWLTPLGNMSLVYTLKFCECRKRNMTVQYLKRYESSCPYQFWITARHSMCVTAQEVVASKCYGHSGGSYM